MAPKLYLVANQFIWVGANQKPTKKTFNCVNFLPCSLDRVMESVNILHVASKGNRRNRLQIGVNMPLFKQVFYSGTAVALPLKKKNSN
jgi:hypothetical protein